MTDALSGRACLRDSAAAIRGAFRLVHVGKLTPCDRGADDVFRDVLTAPNAELTSTAGRGDVGRSPSPICPHMELIRPPRNPQRRRSMRETMAIGRAHKIGDDALIQIGGTEGQDKERITLRCHRRVPIGDSLINRHKTRITLHT